MAFDDQSWRSLQLPHDWAIEGDFSEDNPSGTGGGALPGGVGWYRKHFVADKADQGSRIYIDFDGAYMNATVYINGHRLGTRPYGYISFSYDLTPFLKWGEENVVAVRVDNAEQPNSRWYSGCGIYRNVWLRKLHPIHVSQWGTYVTTDRIDEERNMAELTVRTSLENSYEVIMPKSAEEQHQQCAKVVLTTQLIDADGLVVAESKDTTAAIVGVACNLQQQLRVEQPKLWSVERPYIYKVKSLVSEAHTGERLDLYETSIGIRTFQFDAKRGFSLNGEVMKINGVCLHHDLGCLGAAVNERAIERQLEILKEMGCNAIRCSHNPPAPELLELCDRMGFIVMDEAFDMWRKKKTNYDYARYFNEWHERDLTDLIVRDRNHPSIMVWSIGNEVLEQWNDANADTLSLEEANMILNFGHSKEMLAHEGELSVNSLLTKKLADMVRKLDPTRPVTAGCNEPNPYNHLFRSGALDIIGYNYHNQNVADVPKLFPGKPFIITESNSALMTRGFYVMPSDSMVICPDRWDIPYYDPSFSCSSYDNCHAPWGNTHEETLKLVRDNDFVSGQYVWTGFDYIGEPTPYGWPARSSYFGIVDLAGFPKDVYYLYKSEWTDEPVLHLFPHWNWNPGQEVDLWCYYNNADEVELFVNGVSQGVRTKTKDCLHTMWRTVYEPGTIEVVAYKDGKEVSRNARHTAGEPAQIRLVMEQYGEGAADDALAFVSVEILDKDGNLCPSAENQVSFELEGDNAFIAGVDNGNPISMERFKDNKRKAFYGKCLVVLQADKAGKTVLKATSPGLESAEVIFKTR